MSQVVGIFNGPREVEEARDLIAGAGYRGPALTLLSPAAAGPRTRLRHRGDVMLRSAVRWAVYGSLIVEVPTLIVLFILPVDINVRVFMGSTVWKIGAAFGAWLGGALVSEQGLDEEAADEHEIYLAEGFYILAANVRGTDRPFARGAMIESGAADVRDVAGSFIVRSPKPLPTAVRS